MVLFISQNNYRKRGFVLEVKLYEYIEKKKLEKLLECLYSCLELPLQALNENGQTLCGFGISTPFCDCFKKLLSVYSTPKDSCRELHADAALRALKSQKPYIFSCHANLNHLVYPLYHDSEALGCILIGPFLTAPADTDMLSDIGERYALPSKPLLELCAYTSSISLVSPEKAEEISWLLSYMLPPLFSAKSDSCSFCTTSCSSCSKKQSAAREGGNYRNEQELMTAAIAYISEHYDQPLTLKETADHVKLNPSYFSALFKQCSGSTFKEFLNYIRIEESKKYLINTNYSIIDIAIATGFEDQSYFTKVFKKYTGMTPRQYRN